MDSLRLTMEALAVDYHLSIGELSMVSMAGILIVGTLFWNAVMAWNKSSGSNGHAVLVSALAALNLWIGLSEVYLLAVMAGYFTADSIRYCLCRENALYLFHHALTLFAMYHMLTAPHLSAENFAAKAALVELSTPFMNRYFETKGSLDGAVFALSFFNVRILWLGYIAVQGLRASVHTIEVVMIVAFVALNYYWFWEIVSTAWAALRKSSVHPPAEVTDAIKVCTAASSSSSSSTSNDATATTSPIGAAAAHGKALRQRVGKPLI
jgi:hypothetical protein